MESIRVEKQNVFKIEVNDEGECIELDLLDIELPIKFLNATKELKKQNNTYSTKIKAIQKQYADNEELLMIKQVEAGNNYCNALRRTFDGFLGDGACMKIFGKTNRIGMFDQLVEQLNPIFETLEINIEQIKKDLYEKYKPSTSDVI